MRSTAVLHRVNQEAACLNWQILNWNWHNIHTSYIF